ncbi:MAG: molybdenum cofactor biosynthesis protein MoaE [Acidimicrobiales bacterium]
MRPPTSQPDWLGVSDSPLPAADAAAWVVLPRCGAVVSFTGTARDHSTGRDDVDLLEYEAYEDQVVPRLAQLAGLARETWTDLGRIVLLHRTGRLGVGDAAVVVTVSAPHRDHAFEAARYLIDELKRSVPIWKRERWSEGESWGLEAQHIEEPGPPRDEASTP